MRSTTADGVCAIRLAVRIVDADSDRYRLVIGSFRVAISSRRDTTTHQHVRKQQTSGWITEPIFSTARCPQGPAFVIGPRRCGSQELHSRGTRPNSARVGALRNRCRYRHQRPLAEPTRTAVSGAPLRAADAVLRLCGKVPYPCHFSGSANAMIVVPDSMSTYCRPSSM